MAKNLLSIRIGKKYVKICELQYGANKSTMNVSRILKAKTPEGIISDGFIMDMYAAEVFLSSIIRENNMTATDVIFSISSSKIATKEITTPVMKEKQLNEMIDANASEYFPIYLDDYILTHAVLDNGASKKGDKQMRVLVLAAPKDLIDDYFKIAEKLKLSIQSIDYAGNSAYQMIRKQIGPETSVVVQIQEETTTVNILKDNLLKLQRTIPYGKNLAIETLAKTLNVDEDEAATLLETDRYIHETFDGDPVTESLKHLINNVIRVIDYYNSRNVDEPVEKAYLVGESVSLLGVDFLFANEFDVSVIQLTRFHGVKLENESEVLHRIVTKYVGCLGAGLEPVNFLPKETLDKIKNMNSFRMLKLGCLGSLVAALAICAIPLTNLIVTTAERDDIQKDINKLKSIETVVDQYYTAMDMYKDAKDFKDKTDGRNDAVLAFIEKLEKIQPSDVTLKSINFADGAVSISGVTSTKETIARYIIELKKIYNVSDVFVVSTSENKNEEGVVSSTFSLTCILYKEYDKVDCIDELLAGNVLDYNDLLAMLQGEDAMTINELFDTYYEAYLTGLAAITGDDEVADENETTGETEVTDETGESSDSDQVEE